MRIRKKTKGTQEDLEESKGEPLRDVNMLNEYEQVLEWGENEKEYYEEIEKVLNSFSKIRVCKFGTSIHDFENEYCKHVCNFLSQNNQITRIIISLDSEKYLIKIIESLKTNFSLEELYLNTPSLISFEVEKILIQLHKDKMHLSIHWNSKLQWLNMEQHLKIEKYNIVFN